MFPLRDVTRLSIRCSRDRERVVVALFRGGPSSVPELARRSGVRPARVRATLRGAPPEYGIDVSLVAVGVVRSFVTSRGVEFALTDQGVAEARTILRLREADLAV